MPMSPATCRTGFRVAQARVRENRVVLLWLVCHCVCLTNVGLRVSAFSSSTNLLRRNNNNNNALVSVQGQHSTTTRNSNTKDDSILKWQGVSLRYPLDGPPFGRLRHIALNVRSNKKDTDTTTATITDANNISYSSSSKKNKPPSDKGDDDEDPFFIADPNVFALDLLSILVSCEILGIVDDVTANGFETFLDPVTMESFSTLPLLIQRVSVLSLAWIAACLRTKGYSSDGTTKDEKAVIDTVLRSVVDYCVWVSLFQLLGDGGVIGFHTANQLAVTVIPEIVKETALPLTVLVAFRLVYYSRFVGFY